MRFTGVLEGSIKVRRIPLEFQSSRCPRAIPAKFECSAGVFGKSSRRIPLEFQVPDVPEKFQHNSNVLLEFRWNYRKLQSSSAEIPVTPYVPEKFQKNTVVPLEFHGNSAELAESFSNGYNY